MAPSGLVGRVVTRKAAARRYVRRPYRATPVPTARQRHVLDRLGYGFSVLSFAQLRAAGGAGRWFEEQLRPETVRESPKAQAVAGWFPRLQDAPATKKANHDNDRYQAWEYARDLSNYSLLRRIYSRRTLLENMVELWSNHFHVDAQHYPGFTQRAAYDATIRRHALGSFEELLLAVTLHPAMLMYLDNFRSTAGKFNENHGRELLELHTVGVGAGYDEDAVKASAKILSGHTVADKSTFEAFYDPKRHTRGAVTVLGFSDPNATDDPELAERYLRYLAHHPATAQHVARRLCVRFVSDDPSEALVQRVASAYLASRTDIKATLRAIVAAPEFFASAGQKVRTPSDDLVATCRVLRVNAQSPAGTEPFANTISWQLNSILPFHWPRPDGPPDRGTSWASTTRMLNSWRMHASLAGGWWPRQRVVYRKPTAFLPRKRIRFDQLVDHLSREVLGRPSTDLLLQAACQGCDVAPAEIVTRTHAVMQWKFVRLMAVLLDSPAHMTR
jgi:uncharacterized protein (DUF1800 family)